MGLNMGWTRWIWYVGAVAWALSGLLSLHTHAWLHAKISLTLAILFLAAAYFFQTQQPRNR